MPDESDKNSVIRLNLANALTIASRNSQVPRRGAGGYSYMSEKNGLELLSALRHWDSNGRKPQTVMCADLGWTFHKLKSFLYSSKKWLEENRGDDPEVVRLLGAWSFRQIPGGGFIFRDTGVNVVMNGKSLIDVMHDVADDIRGEFLAWIEADHEQREKFERENLELSPDDVEWFRARIAEVAELYIGVVTPTSIKLIRYDQPTEQTPDAKQE
jgi:hypothetical protein